MEYEVVPKLEPVNSIMRVLFDVGRLVVPESADTDGFEYDTSPVVVPTLL
jgi:hypothetical protein